jgi:hypothetical protein
LSSIAIWAAVSPAVVLSAYLTAKRGWRITTSTLLCAGLLTAVVMGADLLGLVMVDDGPLASIFFLLVIAAALGAGTGTLLRDHLSRRT